MWVPETKNEGFMYINFQLLDVLDVGAGLIGLLKEKLY